MVSSLSKNPQRVILVEYNEAVSQSLVVVEGRYGRLHVVVRLARPSRRRDRFIRLYWTRKSGRDRWSFGSLGAIRRVLSLEIRPQGAIRNSSLISPWIT